MFTPFCVQGLGRIGVPPAGHALWAEVGGVITFVTQISLWYWWEFHCLDAECAGLSGTAQSPWL